MMVLSHYGVSRQEAHAKIKEVSLNAKSIQEKGEKVKLENILTDPYFDQVKIFIFDRYSVFRFVTK